MGVFRGITRLEELIMVLPMQGPWPRFAQSAATEPGSSSSSRKSLTVVLLAAIALSLGLSSPAVAKDARSEARAIYERLTGVPPTPEILAKMEELVRKGEVGQAVDLVFEQDAF